MDTSVRTFRPLSPLDPTMDAEANHCGATTASMGC